MERVPEDPNDEELYELFGIVTTEPLDIPDLAHRWLKQLQNLGGLPDKERYELHRKREGGLRFTPAQVEDPINTAPYADAKSIRLDNGQVLWLRQDTVRGSQEGYRRVSVLDKSQRTEKALLAAVTLLESRRIDIERMCSALHLVDDLSLETLRQLSHKVWAEFDAEPPTRAPGEDDESFRVRVKQAQANEERARRAYGDLQPRSLRYLAALLRYYRPDLDSYSRDHQLALLRQTAVRVNGLLEAVDKLTRFLEYGTPDGMPKAVGDSSRDVRAAELRDIEGLTYREIGAKLDISHRPDYKGDYPSVRKAVGRGRDILERAFGKEGWRKLAQAGRAERRWWHSLNSRQRFVEALVEESYLPTQDSDVSLQDIAEALADQFRGPTVEEYAEVLRRRYSDQFQERAPGTSDER